MQIRIQDKRGGRFIVDDVVLNHYGKAMGASGIALYVSLCRYADNRTQECYPGLRLIQEKTDMTRPTIIDAIARLEKLQLIVTSKTPGRVTVYTLLEPLPEGPGKDEILKKYYTWIKKRRVENSGKKSTPLMVGNVAEITGKKSTLVKNPHHSGKKSDVSGKKSTPELNSINELKERTQLRAVLEDFIQHRKEIRDAITPLALERLIKKLCEYDELTAVAMINQSIENGWKGVFELKKTTKPQGGHGVFK